jgi:SAM-dependent methyltransferase
VCVRVFDRLFHRSRPSGISDNEVLTVDLAYEPALIPPPRLMRREGVQVLEEWFHWAEEWSMVLRLFGGMTRQSTVLEVGCGLGRVAYALRFILSPDGSYYGFDIVQEKINFLERNFASAYPNFHFAWADVHNTTYNPRGQFKGAEYRFPYSDGTFDVVYAASVYTHLLPVTTARYLQESARVLKPGGRCVISAFLLDFYKPEQKRPWGFAQKYFAFDHAYGGYPVDQFAVATTADPENTTAYRLEFLQQMIAQAGLRLANPPLPGVWSGSAEHWVGAQEFLILEHA